MESNAWSAGYATANHGPYVAMGLMGVNTVGVSTVGHAKSTYRTKPWRIVSAFDEIPVYTNPGFLNVAEDNRDPR